MAFGAFVDLGVGCDGLLHVPWLLPLGLWRFLFFEVTLFGGSDFSSVRQSRLDIQGRHPQIAGVLLVYQNTFEPK